MPKALAKMQSLFLGSFLDMLFDLQQTRGQTLNHKAV
jgi:hypothetical protein